MQVCQRFSAKPFGYHISRRDHEATAVRPKRSILDRSVNTDPDRHANERTADETRARADSVRIIERTRTRSEKALAYLIGIDRHAMILSQL